MRSSRPTISSATSARRLPPDPRFPRKPLALPGVDSSVLFEKMSIISKISDKTTATLGDGGPSLGALKFNPRNTQNTRKKSSSAARNNVALKSDRR